MVVLLAFWWDFFLGVGGVAGGRGTAEGQCMCSSFSIQNED